jgi:hypothetical protein
MFASNIEFLGRERDKERLQGADHIRLVKIAANGKSVWFNDWGVLSFLLAIFVLTLAAAPALVNSAADETDSVRASHYRNFATCAGYKTMGVLGREGGLLSLLGVDGHPEPVMAIVKGEGYSLRAVHNGQSAIYVVYVRTDC